MKKQQGSMQIEGAEGGDAIELTLQGNQVGFSLLVAALKAKLKVFGFNEAELSTREMTLTLHIEPKPDDEPEDDDDQYSTDVSKLAAEIQQPPVTPRRPKRKS